MKKYIGKTGYFYEVDIASPGNGCSVSYRFGPEQPCEFLGISDSGLVIIKKRDGGLALINIDRFSFKKNFSNIPKSNI